jgi:hypothetical protein
VKNLNPIRQRSKSVADESKRDQLRSEDLESEDGIGKAGQPEVDPSA